MENEQISNAMKTVLIAVVLAFGLLGLKECVNPTCFDYTVHLTNGDKVDVETNGVRYDEGFVFVGDDVYPAESVEKVVKNCEQ